MRSIPARPRAYHVAGRTPGTGPVIAVLTDGPADVAVAAHAADLARRTGTLLVTAAAVTTGQATSLSAVLHRARAGRIGDDSRAITARVAPILHSAGVAHLRTTLPIPPDLDATRALPVAAVHRMIDRFSAVAVVAAAPLHDPTGLLQPAGAHHSTPVPRPARTPPAGVTRADTPPAHLHPLAPW